VNRSLSLAFFLVVSVAVESFTGLYAVAVTSAEAPRYLHETGLYRDRSMSEIGEGVLPFSPQYPLWSDGTTKRRWILLPQGTSIDAIDPDAFDFPLGTRLWKEFAMGRPIETRMIERLADGSWRYLTYVWSEDGLEAVLAPMDGIASLPVSGAPGGYYQVPSEYDCRACHDDTTAPVLGFTALQLSTDRDPLAPHAESAQEQFVNLPMLVGAGILRNLPQRLLENPPRVVADSPDERAALGYLHANCGYCHAAPSDTGASVPVAVLLAQRVAGTGDAGDVRRSLVDVASRYRPQGLTDARLIVPGAAERSVLALRMRSRNPMVQMPPLGTRVPDLRALALIERWINNDLEPNEGSQP
jgi:hypothetical protein